MESRRLRLLVAAIATFGGVAGLSMATLGGSEAVRSAALPFGLSVPGLGGGSGLAGNTPVPTATATAGASPSATTSASPAPSGTFETGPSADPTLPPTGAATSGATATATNPQPTATSAPTATQPPPPPPGPGSTTMLAGCPVFPSDNPWNEDVSSLPIHPNSDDFIATMLEDNDNLHPDFGGGGAYGIPYVVVPQGQALVPIDYIWWPQESDAGPFPIPLNAPVEGGGDRHVIALRQGYCDLFELYAAEQVGSGWEAGSGARWDLTINDSRPAGWTSADAAGLPILPGLVRYDEVMSGVVTHAIRFTAGQTQAGYIYPASHYASSSTDPDDPPMGLRVRLKAGYDLSGFTGQAQVIAVALKKYGMILADNGSSFYITGASSSFWDDDNLNQLKGIPGDAFEVVDTGGIVTD